MIRLRAVVDPMQDIPAGFAYAYSDPVRYLIVAYRWPLNHVVAWWQWARLWIIHARPSRWNRLIEDAHKERYQQFWDVAYQIGYNQGKTDVEGKEMDRRFQERFGFLLDGVVENKEQR